MPSCVMHLVSLKEVDDEALKKKGIAYSCPDGEELYDSKVRPVDMEGHLLKPFARTTKRRTVHARRFHGGSNAVYGFHGHR